MFKKDFSNRESLFSQVYYHGNFRRLKHLWKTISTILKNKSVEL